MARTSLSLRFKTLLARHPIVANRLLAIIGARGVNRMSKRSARRAAQRAYRYVPFYHDLFERVGFTKQMINHLRWRDFLRLPTSQKTSPGLVDDRTLLDSRVPSPAGDAIIGRSSGTAATKAIWLVGWDEFALARAYYWRLTRDLGGHKRKTAIVQMLAVDGADLTGNLTYRAAVSVKEQTRWPFEVFVAGGDTEAAVAILRWLVRQDYEALLVQAFPGSMERLLDRLEELRASEAGGGVDWTRFKQVRVLMGGQTPATTLRERVRRELQLNANDLLSDMVLYGSSDTGQVVAQTSPFTAWLERYLAEHPELYARLGISEEHRSQPILECIPPLGLFVEQDEDQMLLLTTWKHRPLIRYKTNDLVWLRPPASILRALQREAPGWRRDLRRYGLRRRNIPKVSSIAIVLGRADDVRIVNATNVTPDMLRQALEAAGILPSINHFKHDTNDDRPNEYTVYLELPDARTEAERERLAQEWQPMLLERLVHSATAIDVFTDDVAKPIDLRLIVRSFGADEFEGDAERAKRRYVPAHVRA